MEFRSCPREFDEKVVRVKTGEQERELVFSSFFLSPLFYRAVIVVVENACAHKLALVEETRLATMRS